MAELISWHKFRSMVKQIQVEAEEEEENQGRNDHAQESQEIQSDL